MNFMYYKGFDQDKTTSSSLYTATTFKKKKDTRKVRNLHYGQEGHREDCMCDLCSTDFPLRTHLLLNMSSFTRFDQTHSTGQRRPSTRGSSSMFSFCGWRKKAGGGHGSFEEQQLQEARELEKNQELEKKKQDALLNGALHAPLEPVSLANLKQDCFMIPIGKLKNFFPAGHPIPGGDGARLRMVETSEPDVKMVFHMIGPASAFLPSLTTPVIDLHDFQKDSIIKAFKSTVAGINIGAVLQGMVLLNLEKGGELGDIEYPFMVVWAIDSKRCDFKAVFAKVKQLSFECLDPARTGFTSEHYFDTFDEVATLARPPLDKISRRASTPGTGYIISVFKVFEGDDGQKFERNWLTWSGAKALYCSMTTDVGLRRLALHKSPPYKGMHHYLLMCDCSNFLPHLCSAVKVVPRLRMRLCGDTCLYRPICTV